MSTGHNAVRIDAEAYRAGLRCLREFRVRVAAASEAPVGDNSSAEQRELHALAVEFCRTAAELSFGSAPYEHSPLSLVTEQLCAEIPLALEYNEQCFDAILVRAGTRARDIDLTELGFLMYAAEEAGVRLSRTWLLLLDSSYRRRGKLEPARLFRLCDYTAAAQRMRDRARLRVPDLLKAARAERPAELPRCSRLGHCPVCDGPRHEMSRDDLRTLGGRRASVREWYRAGYRRISELPDDLPFDRQQHVQRHAVVSGHPQIQREALQSFLERLSFPLAFLDFEAFGSALPLYEDVGPFERVPFLFSSQILKTPDSEPQSVEYIMKPGPDDREELCRALVAALLPIETVVVYDATFERAVLAGLSGRSPQFADSLRAINARICDLLVPFRSLWYYHLEQRGRYSMKTILPLLCGFNWSDLTVQDGRQAAELYVQLCLRQSPLDKAEMQLAELRRYCRRDTAGMVALYRALRAASALQ